MSQTCNILATLSLDLAMDSKAFFLNFVARAVTTNKHGHYMSQNMGKVIAAAFFLSGGFVFTSSAFAAEPECVVVVDRQLKDVNKGIEKLREKVKSGSPRSVIDRDMMRFDSSVAGLKANLESCKTENPSADLSQFDQKVAKSVSEYEALKAGETKTKQLQAAKKSWMDVNKYKSYLQKFPSSQPSKLDHSAAFIFSREEVLEAQSDASADEPLKNALVDFVTLLTSEVTKKNFKSTIDDTVGQLDKKGAKTDLEAIIKDLTHMQTVFAPNDPNLSALVLEANDGLKGL